jgi:SAM-dependent methyltransferase
MPPRASFRDPGGFCFDWQDHLFRAVNAQALSDLEAFLASPAAVDMIARGQLVPTRRAGVDEAAALRREPALQGLVDRPEVTALFEHERIKFPSYPYEWAPEMLAAAAHLTLDLALECLRAGYGLKDATPYNVLFRGSKPVFIDLLSFERRHPCDPIWKPHAQFCRTFLLPLLAHKYWGVRPADVFTKHRDGLDPAEVYRYCGPLRRFLPPFLTQVSLPTWLSRKTADKSIYREQLLSNPEKARFILDSLFRRLHRALAAARPRRATATLWSEYMNSHSYAESAFKAKEAFVESALRQHQPKRVLDVGANTGHFSAMAARSGAAVVSIDYDLGCIGLLWQRAQAQSLDILPLAVDLARPSAAKGWRNRECISFLQRADGAFDALLMLAVLHHLLVTERIPLGEVLDLAAELTRRWLIIEFIAPGDEMFQTLTRGRDHLHATLNQQGFERACRQRFQVLRSQHLEGTQRWLYLLEKKT